MKQNGYVCEGIPLYEGVLLFTEEELINRVLLYLKNCPDKLYCDQIVSSDKKYKKRRDGYYTTDSHKSYVEVISDIVCKNDLNISQNGCNYNNGKRMDKINNLRKTYPGFTDIINYIKSGKSDSISETHLVHGLMMQVKSNSFEAIDYQIPTVDGMADKIDLIIRDTNNSTCYITEVKTFGSDESLLRCVLEIETYFRRLNNKFYEKYIFPESDCILKKAILIDKTSYAYIQLELPWAQELLSRFDITVLILDIATNEFQITYKQ